MVSFVVVIWVAENALTVMHLVRAATVVGWHCIFKSETCKATGERKLLDAVNLYFARRPTTAAVIAINDHHRRQITKINYYCKVSSAAIREREAKHIIFKVLDQTCEVQPNVYLSRTH